MSAMIRLRPVKRCLCTLLLTGLAILLMPSTQVWAQEWHWEWGKSFHNQAPTLMHIDQMGNIHGVLPYQQSVVVGDTLFIHPYINPPYINNAIFSYNRHGIFKGAADLYTLDKQRITVGSLLTDNRLNLFTSGHFNARMFTGGATINHGRVPYILQPEVFLLKMHPDHRLDHYSLVSGYYGDMCIGMACIADSGFMAASLHSGPIVPNKVIYPGYDTLVFQSKIITMARMDTGFMTWRVEQVRFVEDWSAAERFWKGADGNVYLTGITYSGVILGSDTVFNPHYPDSVRQLPFIIKIRNDGSLAGVSFINVEIVPDDFAFGTHGSRFYSGHVYWPVVIGNDTLPANTDTMTSFIVKTDSTGEVLWNRLMRFPRMELGKIKFLLSASSDSLYFTTRCKGSFDFCGNHFQLSDSSRLFTGVLDTDGILKSWIFTGSAMDVNPSNLGVDRCGNVVVGGSMGGRLVFGPDTLETPPGKVAGFCAKVTMRPADTILIGPDTVVCDRYILKGPPGYEGYCWNGGLSWEKDLCVSSTGTYSLQVNDGSPCWKEGSVFVKVDPMPVSGLRDTTITTGDSLVLAPMTHCERYLWSTGDTTRELLVRGKDLGGGTHSIWIEMISGACLVRDSVSVTVVYSPGMDEPGIERLRIYPNPASGLLIIESPGPFTRVEIRDLNGTVLLVSENQTRSNSIELSTEKLPAGIFLILVHAENSLWVRKLVKTEN